MSLIKSLKTGQAVIEYVIIFMAIGALVLIGVSPFLQQARGGADILYKEATRRILK